MKEYISPLNRLIVQNPLSYYQENEAKFKKAPASRGAEFQRKAAVKDIDDDSDSEDESRYLVEISFQFIISRIPGVPDFEL